MHPALVLLCSIAVVMAVMTVGAVAMMTAGAMSRFVDCNGLPAASIEHMRIWAGVVCMDIDCGHQRCSGLDRWSEFVIMYYAGTVLIIAGSVSDIHCVI